MKVFFQGLFAALIQGLHGDATRLFHYYLPRLIVGAVVFAVIVVALPYSLGVVVVLGIIAYFVYRDFIQ